MKPNVNPHLPDLPAMLELYLPEGHPSREDPLLTPMQAMALPLLLWLFDPQRARGTGKSYLMAVVLIELAKRGYRVQVSDITSEVTNARGDYRRERYMVDLVMRIAAEKYPRDIFRFDMTHRELIYGGRRPE